MKTVFGTAIARATHLTRARNLSEATRVIQGALSGRPLSASDEYVPEGTRSIELKPQSAASSQGFQPGAQNAELASPGLQDAALDRGPAVDVRKTLGKLSKLLRKGGDLPGFPPPVAVPFGKSPKAPQVPVPSGAVYLTRSFTCEAGAREYKVYVPSHTGGRKCPLLIMLHGCTQNPDDFAVGTGMNRVAEEHGFIVAYPRQSMAANQSGCWNWFNPKDQMRNAGEPSIIAGITRSIMAEFDVDPQRVYVAGLSAGGAMAAIMSATYPELYAATGIHSGLACGAAADVASAFAAMRGTSTSVPGRSKSRPKGTNGRVRTIVFHGASDHNVHPSNADKILAEARGGLAGTSQEIQYDGVAGGRAYKRTVISDASGVAQAELWAVEGLGHAWSGGDPDGSYTDRRGPDASREMLRFFLESSSQT
jgi:poly(hydroxyalkanoate) depolymerase family esterase